ncbi:MAG TPA: hypothetical protein VFT27_06610 [Actinomycetota bacterium]|nr:hypothetical protein [Actinomycetota bacterium]
MSSKTIVTTFQTSAAGSADGNGVAHAWQNLARSAFSSPHEGRFIGAS